MSFLEYFSPFYQGLLEPSVLLFAAYKAYAELLFHDLHEDGLPAGNLRNRAFAKFWAIVSAPADPVEPLVGSAVLVPPLLAQAQGLVLDIGPGSGTLVKYFEPAAQQIRHIYGAEPTIDLHPLIRNNVATTEIGAKYDVLHASATRASIAQELIRSGVVRSIHDSTGIFDTIVCVRVLCSVPDLDATLSDLHAMLKPGGKLLICEHTVNMWNSNGSLMARVAQKIYMLLGWSYFVGDCSLTRDIENTFRKSMGSKWSNIELHRSFDKKCLTYISGTLTKNKS